MTDAEYLISQGWRPCHVSPGYWYDPSIDWGKYPEGNAIHTAKRRQGARERKELKQAGAEYSDFVMGGHGGDPIRCWAIRNRFIGHTRAEASRNK
jgi:hypothetical protein